MGFSRWIENLVAFDERALEPEERAFVREWMTGIDEKMTRFAMVLGSTYLLVLMPFMVYTVPSELLAYSYISHTAILLLIGVLALYAHLTGGSLIKAGMVVELGVSLMITYFAIRVLELKADPDFRWMALVALVSVNGWLMLGFPSHYRAWKYAAAWYITVPIVALSATDLSVQAQSVVVAFFGIFLAGKATIAALLKREGLRTYHFQKLAVATERQKIEHELMLAKRIQNSMQPAEVRRLGSGAKLMVYKTTHSEVGGDWVAVRTLPTGENIIVVADAVGKGIQAALVTHAIQSLWAYRLVDKDFDPPDWIRSVNSALVSLGATETHAATMGLLVLTERGMTYWSAAHPPLYLYQRKREEVTPLAARGNMLGIGLDLDLKCVTHPYDPKGDTLIFGSDGVFDKGSRHTKSEIVALCNSVRILGARSLDGCLTQDDKTCVLIEPGSHLKAVA